MNYETVLRDLNNLTGPLKNAKVMASQKQCEAEEKVMSIRKNPLKNSLF